MRAKGKMETAMTYLVSCVVGLEPVVIELLNREGAGAIEVLLVEEGIVVFAGNMAPEAVRRLNYVNNSFLLLAQFAAPRQAGFAALLGRLLARQEWVEVLQRSSTLGFRTFRLMLSDENHLRSGDVALLARLTRLIETASGLERRLRGGDTEFWVLRRRSGMVFFALRLSQRAASERSLQRGELPAGSGGTPLPADGSAADGYLSGSVRREWRGGAGTGSPGV